MKSIVEYVELSLKMNYHGIAVSILLWDLTVNLKDRRVSKQRLLLPHATFGLIIPWPLCKKQNAHFFVKP